MPEYLRSASMVRPIKVEWRIKAGPVIIIVLAAVGLYMALYDFAAWNSRMDREEEVAKGQAETRVMLADLGDNIKAAEREMAATASWLIRYAESMKRSMAATEMVRGVVAIFPKIKPEELDRIIGYAMAVKGGAK